MTSVGAAAGRLETFGCGVGVVIAAEPAALGAARARGAGLTAVAGRTGGAVRAGVSLALGRGTVVFAGAPGWGVALGRGVGLGDAIGAGLGLGVGRGAGPRMIGLSVSTGPCARGLAVGREPGIEKSGKDCAVATPGTSAASSAAAPLAVPTLPPNSRITPSHLPAGPRASASGTE